ncbi:MAG: hypothetical protein LBQ28_09155 [Prevotellaceae bacterium]|jgi:hypothetical protein|nr:hypothetical protein [Prevotellaceae bacterium]
MKNIIAKNIRQIVGDAVRQTSICKILSVNGRTCDVKTIDSEITIEGVRLNTDIESENGLILKPAVDSYVLVTQIDEANYFVSFFSEIDAVDVVIEETTINIDKNGIVINGGALDGLVKINELTQKLNDFISAFNSHTHSVTTNGSSTTQTGITQTTTSQAQQFNKSDYENEKIKQ